MTTYASPSLGGSTQALWRVEMAPGAAGPEHVMDTEQIWTLLRGGAHITLDGHDARLGTGDTVVLPPGRLRRVTADPDTGFAAIVTGPGGAVASGPGRDPVTPAWIA